MAHSTRLAKPEDIEVVMSMTKAMHAESPRYSKRDYNEDKVRALFTGLIDNGCVIVVEKTGGVIGLLAAICIEYYFGGDKFATDICTYVDPAHRGRGAFPSLVAAFEEWAQERGAIELSLGVSAGVKSEETVDCYNRLGYDTMAYGLVKEI